MDGGELEPGGWRGLIQGHPWLMAISQSLGSRGRGRRSFWLPEAGSYTQEWGLL